MPPINSRSEILDLRIKVTMNTLRHEIERRLEQKGRGTFTSSHEILGIVTEEYLELVDAVKLKGAEREKAHAIKKELLDIAVGCVFGVACIDNGEMDWL